MAGRVAWGDRRRNNVDYAVDSQDYCIDTDKPYQGNYLDSVPASASLDNKPSGADGDYEGSHRWHMDNSGRMRSLYHYFPTNSNTGCLDAVP